MFRNPYYDPRLPHRGKYGFHNPDGAAAGHGFSIELAREFGHFLGEMRRFVGEPWPFPGDHVIPAREALAAWHDCTDAHKLMWIGHACFLVQVAGLRVLTDPFLGAYASPLPMRGTRRLVPAALSVAELPGVDVILLSHNHYDHMDAAALAPLARRFPDAQVIVPLGLARALRAFGFRRVSEHDWWERIPLGPLNVTVVPAIHTSRRGLTDTNRTLWCGFVADDGLKSVYFAGDTAYGDVFGEIGRRVGPVSLGLVPIGAYDPRPIMRKVHCTPEEAIRIGNDIGAEALIGMHWGTIRLTLEPMTEPRERFLAAPGGPRRRTLRIGETLRFSDTVASFA